MGYIIPDNTCASSVTPVYGYILMDMVTRSDYRKTLLLLLVYYTIFIDIHEY